MVGLDRELKTARAFEESAAPTASATKGSEEGENGCCHSVGTRVHVLGNRAVGVMRVLCVRTII